MNSSNWVFISFVIFIAYLCIGVIYSTIHMRLTNQAIRDVDKKATKLKRLVRRYELTPKGAEYYAELQDLYVTHDTFLREAELLKKKPYRYTLTKLFRGQIFWPLYVYIARKRKKQAS